jgi:hypothetical protein
MLANWIEYPEGTGLVQWEHSGRLFLEDFHDHFGSN